MFRVVAAIVVFLCAIYLFFVPTIVKNRTVFISTNIGVGTGVIINSNEILTNHHVVDKATKIMVAFPDGQVKEATIVVDNKKPDLAVIKLKNYTLPWYSQTYISCGVPQVLGEDYFTIGQTLGYFEWDYHPITYGTNIIGGYDKSKSPLGSHMVIFTGNSVNHGNSGGGIFDLFGIQVGIVTAITQHGDPTKEVPVNVGEIWGITGKDICPVLDQFKIKYHRTYNLNDLIYWIDMGYKYIYYEVVQL